jgi:hypothetical protein
MCVFLNWVSEYAFSVTEISFKVLQLEKSCVWEAFIFIRCSPDSDISFYSGHPRYFNQLSTGLDMVGLAADWLTSTANTNM